MNLKPSWTLLTLSLGLLLTACPSSTPSPAADTTPPTVSLTASPSSLTSAGNVTLSATASDAIGVTKVEFYQGTNKLGEDVSAPYTVTEAVTSAQNGTRVYTAKAYDAANNAGSSSEQSVTVNIGGGGGTNRNPTADFSLTISGLLVTPTNSSSDPDGDPLTYSWNWGDSSATSSGTNPAHTYAAAGPYTVTLTANDGRGGTNITTRSTTVSSGPLPLPNAKWDDPTALWDASGLVWQ